MHCLNIKLWEVDAMCDIVSVWQAGRPALSKLAKAMMASGVWKAGGNVMDNLLAAARLPTNAFERLSELPGQALVRLADGPAKVCLRSLP